MKTSKTYLLCVLFGLFVASQALAQGIVGAWTRGDTTKEGSSVIVFLANGFYYIFENVRAPDASVRAGFELGKYDWNPKTGALTGTIYDDHITAANSTRGWRTSYPGGTLTLSCDGATLSIPGSGAQTLTRITGASPIVGAWYLGINMGVLVFLPNGTYYEAYGPANGGIEYGTYSWNPASGQLATNTSPTPYVDSIRYEWGLSNEHEDWGPSKRVKAWSANVSADGRTLTLDNGDQWSGFFQLARDATEYVTLMFPANYQGMWVVPNLAEAGWGISVTHQQDLIFASWFTYEADGKPLWLSMTAKEQPDGSFTGAIDRTTGPPFNAVPFDSSRVTHTKVGTGRLSFNDMKTGTFTYMINDVAQTKAITRFQFATPMPSCSFLHYGEAAPDARNYQDMWVVPNLAESGWGISFTHQGDLLFATWFMYDLSGNPAWVSATLAKTSEYTYSGALDATTGPPFFSVPFDPSRVTHSTVGNAKVDFNVYDDANATFIYTLNGVSQTKRIARFVFRGRGTICHH